MVDVAHRFVRKRVRTYADTYDLCFQHGVDWVVTHKLEGEGLRTRYWTSRHLLKLVTTQSLGQLYLAQRVVTTQRIRTVYRTADLERRLRLRKLQHAILRYLWRPGGALMRTTWSTV